MNKILTIIRKEYLARLCRLLRCIPSSRESRKQSAGPDQLWAGLLAVVGETRFTPCCPPRR